MTRFRDLTGQKFGKLTVLHRVPAEKGKRTRWVCSCECGSEKKAVRLWRLVSGETTSCGCHQIAVVKATMTKHGFRGTKKTPTYASWQSMLTRCTNPADVSYAYYGGRGIAVCERWLTFENFLADMGVRPEGLTLDRYPDNDGNYEPGNCRWATASEQAFNRRPKRRV